MRRKPHKNAKYTYPYWKTCQACFEPFPCQNREQMKGKKACSRTCTNELIARTHRGKDKPLEERKGQVIECPVCGTKVWKPAAWLRKVELPTCSSRCNGFLRGREWGKHGHKGRAAWSEESLKGYSAKMSGPNNPAWKGGVTYFGNKTGKEKPRKPNGIYRRRKGNYKNIKYVRCPVDLLSMARKDGYIMEHRLIVARAIGRMLLRTEVVHHEDHDPWNNTLENLMLFASNRDHKLYEHHGTPAPIWCVSSQSTT
jgi:hypothetical protein